VFATVWAIPLVAQLVPESARYWAIWILPVARLPEFLAGMLLARIVAEGKWPVLGVWPLAILAMFAYFASLWLPWNLRLVAGTAVPLALLVGAVGADDAADKPTPWRRPWLVRLGELAFAFFLVHQLALRVVVRLAGPADSAVMSMAVVVAAFCLALMGSWLLYRFVEVPGMHLLRRKHG
jgi:peptidoglycan/LPS O-acetylase OafA/YrhL